MTQDVRLPVLQTYLTRPRRQVSYRCCVAVFYLRQTKVKVGLQSFSWRFRLVCDKEYAHCTHTHPPSGVETWRAGSWLPCVSSRLLPRLYGWRPRVKGRLDWLAFLSYSCPSALFALPNPWASAAALCCHFQVRVHGWDIWKNWMTVLCFGAETSLEYLLIHEKRQAGSLSSSSSSSLL